MDRDSNGHTRIIISQRSHQPPPECSIACRSDAFLLRGDIGFVIPGGNQMFHLPCAVQISCWAEGGEGIYAATRTNLAGREWTANQKKRRCRSTHSVNCGRLQQIKETQQTRLDHPN